MQCQWGQGKDEEHHRHPCANVLSWRSIQGKRSTPMAACARVMRSVTTHVSGALRIMKKLLKTSTAAKKYQNLRLTRPSICAFGWHNRQRWQCHEIG